jgi:hypothetical protein
MKPLFSELFINISTKSSINTFNTPRLYFEAFLLLCHHYSFSRSISSFLPRMEPVFLWYFLNYL